MAIKLTPEEKERVRNKDNLVITVRGVQGSGKTNFIIFLKEVIKGTAFENKLVIKEDQLR